MKYRKRRGQPLAIAGEGVKLTAAAADGSGRRVTINAYNGGELRVAGFPLPVVVDLQGVAVPKQNLPLLLSHENHDAAVFGVSDKVTISAGSITVEGRAAATSDRARNVLALHDAGLAWQSSIGAQVLSRQIIAAGQSVAVNGRTFTGPIIVARRSRLDEITIVPFGADRSTSVAAAAFYRKGSKMDFAQWLAAAGFELNQLSAAQRSALEAQHAAAAAAAETDDDDDAANAQLLADGRRLHAAEQRRVGAIGKLCGSSESELAARAIEAGWSSERVELELLRNRKPVAATFTVGGRSVAVNGSVIEAAAAASMGLSDAVLLKQYWADRLNAADPLRGLTLQGLIRAAARLEGQTLPEISLGVDDFVRAAFSTVSLPDILSNLANKSLLAGMSYIEDTWSRVCSISSVSDFKKHTRLRLTSRFAYEKVGPNGELKDVGSVGSEKYETQVDTYGITFGLSRKLLTDDDLGAFGELPNSIGRGAADALNREFWTLWLDNTGNFFGTANGNQLTGAGAALVDYTDLAAGRDKFRQIKDSHGNRLRIKPTILLVPGGLQAAAEYILAPLLLNQTPAGNAAAPMNNPAAGKYSLEVSDYLDDEDFHANASATAWYLLAPSDVNAAFDVAFLNGQRSPTLERTAIAPGQLGMAWQAYFDFGVAQKDYRGAVQVTGEAE